jgi:hypothetical protein
VITLGEEVWETFRRIPKLNAAPPKPRFADLYGADYGTTGSITVAGRKVTWRPLVHPGLLRGKTRSDAPIPSRPRTSADWAAVHARWKQSLP